MNIIKYIYKRNERANIDIHILRNFNRKKKTKTKTQNLQQIGSNDMAFIFVCICAMSFIKEY